jgi:threonine aldolase
MPAARMKALQEAGARFYDWPTPHGFDGDIGEGEQLCRFVTSFATTADEVDAFASLVP